MTSSNISKRSQVAVLYLLACAWNALWFSGLLSMKRARFLIWDILTMSIPLLYLYLLIRFAAVEHDFIRKHPCGFYGAVAVGILPWIIFLIVVLCLRP